MKKPKKPHLPEFARPPIVELVLGLQFGRVPGLNIAHLVGLAELFSAEYPTLQEMPPLTPSFEVFGLPTNQIPTISFAPFLGMRIWVSSKDETSLIQLQPDRLVLNWRKMSPTDEYPRYTEMQR